MSPRKSARLSLAARLTDGHARRATSLLRSLGLSPVIDLIIEQETEREFGRLVNEVLKNEPKGPSGQVADINLKRMVEEVVADQLLEFPRE